MSLSNDFHMDIKTIHIAHEYVLDRVHKCEYPRGRGTYGLIYALGGRAEYRFFAGERLTIHEGDVLFLSPHTAYSIVTEKEFKHYTVNFAIHEESSNLVSLNQPYYLLQEKNIEQIERLFKKLIGIWNLKKTGYDMQATGCLYELIRIFYFDYFNRHYAVSYQRLLPAKEYIEQHFDQSITLEHLAFLSSMSVTNFRREWNKLYTETPLRYRDSIRLHYAKEYLNSGYYTISEIAGKCGFDDVSYFVRFFKKQAGITPGEFKKQLL